MGASLRTVVRRLTVETVTRRRKVVSTRAHLLMASHSKKDRPMGRRMAALPAHEVNRAVNKTPLNITMPGGRRPQLGHVIFREVPLTALIAAAAVVCHLAQSTRAWWNIRPWLHLQ